MDSTAAALLRWLVIVMTLGGATTLLPPSVVPAALAGACTWYTAPGAYTDAATSGRFDVGNTTNTGTSAASPVPFLTSTGAGSVFSHLAAGNTNTNVTICLEGGTYTNDGEYDITRGGSAAGYEVIRPYNSSPVTVLANHITDNAEHGLIEFFGAQYMQIEGLTIDGGGGVQAPIFTAANGATYPHHLRIYNNVIQGGAISGIQFENTDYVDVENNIIRVNGHPTNGTYVANVNQSGSGISDNLIHNLDTTPGFHAIISGNIVVGNSDNQAYVTSGVPSDGNGIIMDRSENYANGATATNTATPPALIANNVIYENYGRCINIFITSNNVVTNNTCYSNSEGFIASNPSRSGEIIDGGSSTSAICNDPLNNHFYNNIVYGFSHASSAGLGRYDGGGCATFANESWAANTYTASSLAALPTAVTTDPAEVQQDDPLFASLPPVNSGLADQTIAALNPAGLASGLEPQAASPVRGTGIDPTTLPGWVADSVTGSSVATLAAQMAPYVTLDVLGHTRPAGVGWDRGAYQMSSGPLSGCRPVVWTSVAQTGTDVGADTFTAAALTVGKTGSSTGFLTGAGSTTAIASTAGSGSVQATATSTTQAQVIGLTNSTIGATPSSIQFGIELTASGTYVVFESGATPGGAPAAATFSSGDTFGVAVSGTTVRYTHNGTRIYTSALSASYPLKAAVSISSIGTNLSNSTICHSS